MNVSKETAFISFTCIALTGPVIGVVTGGYIVSKLGGYTNPKALNISILFITVGGIAGMIACFVDNFLLCVFLWWMLYFAGGFTLPVLVANLMYNLIGYFPSPFIYGIVYEATGGEKSRWGLFAL
jgi:hypothetical protein